jgi:hypothetical protein
MAMRTNYPAAIEPWKRHLKWTVTRDSEDQGMISARPLISRRLQLVEAVTSLENLLDEATSRANTARASAGWSAPIRLRHHQAGRCYYTPGQHGHERTLSLHVSVPLRDGELFGGAYITPGGARSAIYVVPVIDAEPVRWEVQIAGCTLTGATVDDLFLATFGEDAGAARRLAPFYGFDLFASPWS